MLLFYSFFAFQTLWWCKLMLLEGLPSAYSDRRNRGEWSTSHFDLQRLELQNILNLNCNNYFYVWDILIKKMTGWVECFHACILTHHIFDQLDGLWRDMVSVPKPAMDICDSWPKGHREWLEPCDYGKQQTEENFCFTGAKITYEKFENNITMILCKVYLGTLRFLIQLYWRKKDGPTVWVKVHIFPQQ